jgi:basic membrane protein A
VIAEQPPAKTKLLRVGVLMPGSPTDGGFMESAARGVGRARTAFPGRVAIETAERVSRDKMQQALTALASNNDLVIAIGGQTDAAVRAVAAEFSDRRFVEIGGPPDTAGNLAMYDCRQAEIAFAAGALAALETVTGKVQFLSAFPPTPAIVTVASEFERGAAHAKPAVTVASAAYFDDVAKTDEAARAGIAAGVDVHYQMLNAGLASLLAVAGEHGTRVIGGPLPRDCTSDPVVLGYTKSDIGLAVEYAIARVLDGGWRAEYVSFGLGSPTGASEIVACTASVETRARLRILVHDIRNGRIKTARG